MRTAFETAMAHFDPLITSIEHGGHVANSAHYQGRAIDVGAFGGTPVGMNEPTVAAVIAAIFSREFEKIGTFGELANNPRLQELAKQYGVELFTDEGSGRHVHLQVGAS
jgi:hypothetical protein